jgi:hypothetical protein
MKPAVEPTDIDIVTREVDENRLESWERKDADFVWGPVSTTKKWMKRLARHKKERVTLAEHFRSPDIVVASSPGVEASSAVVAVDLRFRAGTWKDVADVRTPVGMVTENATVVHRNSDQGKALRCGKLCQQEDLQAILVHQYTCTVCCIYCIYTE